MNFETHALLKWEQKCSQFDNPCSRIPWRKKLLDSREILFVAKAHNVSVRKILNFCDFRKVPENTRAATLRPLRISPPRRRKPRDPIAHPRFLGHPSIHPRQRLASKSAPRKSKRSSSSRRSSRGSLALLSRVAPRFRWNKGELISRAAAASTPARRHMAYRPVVHVYIYTRYAIAHTPPGRRPPSAEVGSR